MNFYIGNSIDEIDEQDVNIEFSDELIEFIYKMSGRVSFDMSKLYKIDPYDDVEVSKNDLFQNFISAHIESQYAFGMSNILQFHMMSAKSGVFPVFMHSYKYRRILYMITSMSFFATVSPQNSTFSMLSKISSSDFPSKIGHFITSSTLCSFSSSFPHQISNSFLPSGSIPHGFLLKSNKI